jgi:hypothetical protein
MFGDPPMTKMQATTTLGNYWLKLLSLTVVEEQLDDCCSNGNFDKVIHWSATLAVRDSKGFSGPDFSDFDIRNWDSWTLGDIPWWDPRYHFLMPPKNLTYAKWKIGDSVTCCSE